MWKEPTQAILSRHLSVDAANLCLRYFEALKSVDEVGQGRGALPDIVRGFSDLLTGYVGNKFYAEHRGALTPVMVLGIKSWLDAVDAAKNAATDDDKVRVVMGRRAFHELACACAMIEGKDTSTIRADLVSSMVL